MKELRQKNTLQYNMKKILLIKILLIKRKKSLKTLKINNKKFNKQIN